MRQSGTISSSSSGSLAGCSNVQAGGRAGWRAAGSLAAVVAGVVHAVVAGGDHDQLDGPPQLVNELGVGEGLHSRRSRHSRHSRAASTSHSTLGGSSLAVCQTPNVKTPFWQTRHYPAPSHLSRPPQSSGALLCTRIRHHVLVGMTLGVRFPLRHTQPHDSPSPCLSTWPHLRSFHMVDLLFLDRPPKGHTNALWLWDILRWRQQVA